MVVSSIISFLAKSHSHFNPRAEREQRSLLCDAFRDLDVVDSVSTISLALNNFPVRTVCNGYDTSISRLPAPLRKDDGVMEEDVE